MIRNARAGDIPAVYALLEEAYGRSIYAGRDTIDSREAKRLLLHAIQRTGSKTEGGTMFIVAEHHGEVTGFMVGMLDRVYHIGHKLMATDLFFYQGPGAPGIDATGMLGKFMTWVIGNDNVIEAKLGVTNALAAPEQAEQLYQRAGFARVGSMWEWRIKRTEVAA